MIEIGQAIFLCILSGGVCSAASYLGFHHLTLVRGVEFKAYTDKELADKRSLVTYKVRDRWDERWLLGPKLRFLRRLDKEVARRDVERQARIETYAQNAKRERMLRELDLFDELFEELSLKATNPRQ